MFKAQAYRWAIFTIVPSTLLSRRPFKNGHPPPNNMLGQSPTLVACVILLFLSVLLALLFATRAWIVRRGSKKTPPRKLLLPTVVERKAELSAMQKPSIQLVAWHNVKYFFCYATRPLSGALCKLSFRSGAEQATCSGAPPAPLSDKSLDAWMNDLESGLKTDGPQPRSVALFCPVDDFKEPTISVLPAAIPSPAPLSHASVLLIFKAVVATTSVVSPMSTFTDKALRSKLLDFKLVISRNMINTKAVRKKFSRSRHFKALRPKRTIIVATEASSLISFPPSLFPTEEVSSVGTIPSIIVTSPSGEQLIPIIADSKPGHTHKPSSGICVNTRRVAQALRKPPASRTAVYTWIILSTVLAILSILSACFRIAHHSVYIHLSISQSLSRSAIPFSVLFCFLLGVTPLLVAVFIGCYM
ncbi:hypothetical protein OF83DRAFT_1281424 [Amylostereum chailletii]|nr:hypothetical protein OF83DRAFT_1281424 [Amylostereum chailletii]